MAHHNERFNHEQPDSYIPEQELNHVRIHRIPYIPPHVLRRPPHNQRIDTFRPQPPATAPEAGAKSPFPEQDYPAQMIDAREAHDHDTLRTAVYTATEKSLAKDSEKPSDDAVIGDSNAHFVGVFDGVGNARMADVAAREAANTFSRLFSAAKDDRASADTVRTLLTHAMQAAHERINSIDDRNALRGNEPPATTATFARVFQDDSGQQFAAIASVGDSRAYRYRPANGTTGELFEKLTVDQAAYIPARLQNKFDHIETIDELFALPDNESALWKRQNVIGGVLAAGQAYSLQMHIVPVAPGDRLVLTTDGIHDNLSAQQLRSTMANSDAVSLPTTLVALAQSVSKLSRSENIRAKPDDMSCGVMEVE